MNMFHTGYCTRLVILVLAQVSPLLLCSSLFELPVSTSPTSIVEHLVKLVMSPGVLQTFLLFLVGFNFTLPTQQHLFYYLFTMIIV